METDIVNPLSYLRYLGKGSIPDISYADTVLVLYDNSIAKYLKRNFRTRKIAGFSFNCYLIEENVVICHGFGIGSPAAVAAAEELIAAGAKQIISVGTAGGISPGLKLGDYTVCTKTLSDEGTSQHYVSGLGFIFPDENLTSDLYELIRDHFENAYKVSTWTTDAPYRETSLALESYQLKGINTVEMESSALFALGQFRNIPMASVFVIGDILSVDGWRPGFLERKVQSNIRLLLIKLIEYYTSFYKPTDRNL